MSSQNLLLITAAMQGCGSVLATQNLDTITFTYSTQQRCSSSQPFIKPRLIARPTQAQPLGSGGAAADQKLSGNARATKPAHLNQPSDPSHRTAPGSHGRLSAQGTGRQAEQPDRAQLCEAAASSNCASGTDDISATEEPDYQRPHCESLEHLSTPRQANEGSRLDSGDGTQHHFSGASASTQYDCDIAFIEQDRLPEAAVRSEGSADDSSSEAAALLGWLDGLQLRYFTPREVANLHSFPDSFSFPAHVTRRQQYALLGNSLSVAVVADLLTYMLEG